MISAAQAIELMKRTDRLKHIEAVIDAKIRALCDAGWPQTLTVNPAEFKTLEAGDFPHLLQRYIDHGWRIVEARDRLDSDQTVIFEHPAKQFERGGPNDR